MIRYQVIYITQILPRMEKEGKCQTDPGTLEINKINLNIFVIYVK